MINLLLVDDQILLLDLMEQMLKDSAEIEVVARAAEGSEAVRLAGEYRPDVILMDLLMPGMGGIEATKLIKATNSEIKILVLTTSTEIEDISEALAAGADGYILKSMGRKDLLLSITGVYRNLEIIQGEVSEKMRQQKTSNTFRPDGSRKISVSGITASLTLRELEIIALVVQGKSTAEMAAVLYLSEGRIRNVITEILSKLQLKDRAQLAVFALKNKLA
jgi:DNA-binding NarL/FixJ family response regulator